MELLEAVNHVPVDLAVTRNLLLAGVDPCTLLHEHGTSTSPVFRAVEQGDASLLALLLEFCSQLEALSRRNDRGMTPLMLASSLGDEKCACALLKRLEELERDGEEEEEKEGCYRDGGLRGKVSPKEQDLGESVIQASLGGHADLVSLLLRHGASPHATDSKGRTPAHLMAVQGRLGVLQLLKECGSRLWERDLNGNTPMHFCTHGHVLEFLYQEGVHPSIRNRQGSTAMDILKRLHASTQVMAVLAGLERREKEEEASSARGRRGRALQFPKEVLASLGWKVAAVLLVVLAVLAWQMAVRIHGRSPWISSHSPMN